VAAGYNVYYGAGGEANIDWSAPVGHVAAGVATIDLAGLGLAEDADHFFGLRAESDSGVEETHADRVVRVRVSGGELVGPPPNPLVSASARPAAGGKVQLDFFYSTVGAAGEATGVEVATRASGSRPDFVADLLQTVAITRTGARSVLLDASFSHGEVVRLAARAVTAAGTGGPATLLEAVVADAQAPADVNHLVAEQAS